MPGLLLSLLLAMDAVSIPAGEFTQGNGREPDAPVRQVTLSAYRIDRTEVSIQAYELWAAQGYRTRDPWSDAGWAWLQEHPTGAGAVRRAAGRSADHPVVAVTWFEADAYCRAQGGQLPTEAQWEHAACGDGGQRFPWGESEDVSPAWYAYGKHGVVQGVLTEPVGRQDATLHSPMGLLHAAGNVWEWTADGYDRDGTSGDATDPVGPADSPWRVLKGGSFTSLPSVCSCSHREPALPDRVAYTTGFRCAWPAAPDAP